MNETDLVAQINDIRAEFEQGVADIKNITANHPPQAFISADDLADVARAGRCADCGEGHGIHVEFRGGAIEWTPVQAHTPECPRSALCGADVADQPCLRPEGHDGPHNYRYPSGLPTAEEDT